MKRKLDKKELMFVNKMLNIMKEEVEWNEYQISYHDLMLGNGLEVNHKKNIRDFKQKRHEFKSELNLTNEKIKILTDQIRNGVEIKENKTKKREEKK